VTGPVWASFASGVVANGEDEVHVWGVGGAELVPALASQAADRVPGVCHLLDGKRIDRSARVATGGEPLKRPFPIVVTKASAMMLRAELPVQRNSTL
jgi:hypothetical protein